MKRNKIEILEGEIRKKKLIKKDPRNKPIQPKLICQTSNSSHEIEITIHKAN
jgi:hypothetical protein